LFTAIVAIEVSGVRVVDRLEDLEGADGMFRNEPDNQPKSSFLQTELTGMASIDSLAESLPTSPEEVHELLQTEAPAAVIAGLDLVHNFLGGLITGDALQRQRASNNDCNACRTRAETAVGATECSVTNQQLCDAFDDYETVKGDWLDEQEASHCEETKSICRHYSLQRPSALTSGIDSGSITDRLLTAHTANNHDVIQSIVDYAATADSARDGFPGVANPHTFPYKAVETHVSDDVLTDELRAWRDHCFETAPNAPNGGAPWISFYDHLHELERVCQIAKACRSAATEYAGDSSDVSTALEACFGADGPTNVDGVSTRVLTLANGNAVADTETTGPNGHQHQHDLLCRDVQRIDEMVLRVRCMIGTEGADISEESDCPPADYDWDHDNRTRTDITNGDRAKVEGTHYTYLKCASIRQCKGPAPGPDPPTPSSLICDDTDADIAMNEDQLPYDSTHNSASNSVYTNCHAAVGSGGYVAGSVGDMPDDWQCNYVTGDPGELTGHCYTGTYVPADGTVVNPYVPYQGSNAVASTNS